MGARVRCRGCRNYFAREEAARSDALGAWCSEECVKTTRDRTRAKATTKRPAEKPRPKPKKAALDTAMRQEIRRRDGNRCRWCGVSSWLQVHHVRYRSEGGPDAPHNLLTLCGDHHAEAHASKRRWQPVLLALLWIGYVEGTWLTVPEVSRRLRRLGLTE